MEHSTIYWVGFLFFIFIMLILDLGVFHKKNSAMRVREAITWSVFWISLALIFNLGIYFVMGKTPALEFFTAYVLEKSLSVDNLFVFILIFSYFNIASKYQHKILFWGIFGALIMRAMFIFAGIALISQFSWIMYIFGVFLVYTGVGMFFEKEDKSDFNPEKNIVIRMFKKLMPVANENPDARFFLRKDKVLYASTFFVALLFIEVSDLIFAVDSIPAVLSVSKDTFIVFTSNIFAILGLRSLYFALSGVMRYFHYLKYALAAILSFIGIKMCMNEFCATFGYPFHISNYVSLAVIVGLLTLSVVFSALFRKRQQLTI